MTNGGDRLRRWAPLAITAGLLAVAVAGNLASILDQRARSGLPVSPFAPLLDELSSALVWLALIPLIVRTFKLLVPPRVPWTTIAPLHMLAGALVSLAHYGLTRVLRAIVWIIDGEGFPLQLSWEGYLGDLYKDLLSYLLFGLIYWGAEIVLARRAGPACEKVSSPEVLEVRDGAQTRYVPIADILWVEAAGNYVELHLASRRDILMRATLASLAARLEAAGFLRVHRSRLVNPVMITSLENLPAGEVAVVLMDGARIVASRRYRQMLSETLGARAV